MIKDKYQGKHNLFRRLYGFLFDNIQNEPVYVEAYADKRNKKSIGILTRLGLSIIGENKNGISFQFRGKYEDLLKWYNSK